ncbi:MAG TPA: hypothetical protein VKX16_04650 [Chloroflexota bacterium]|nr:hypothetical protein [Chloroflexota bacterium]
MNALRRVLSRAGLITAAGALALLGMVNAHATGQPQTLQNLQGGLLGHDTKILTPRGVTVHAASFTRKGPSTFIYLDLGLNYDDEIDVFLSNGNGVSEIQKYTNYTIAQQSSYFGASTLHYFPADGVHTTACLVVADQANGRKPAILSFRLGKDGKLAKRPASTVIDPLGGWGSGGLPSDVQGYDDVAVVTESPMFSTGGVETFVLGAGCTLAAGTQIPNSTFRYYISSSVNGSGVIAEPDQANSQVDLYSTDLAGNLTYLGATSSQFRGLDSSAQNGSNLFTGDANGTIALAQGGTVSGGTVTWDPTSPQFDPAGSNNASSWFDSVDGNYVNGEQAFGAPAGIGFYSGDSSFKFLSHAATGDPYSYVVNFGQTGSTLWVNDGDSFIDACLLTSGGSSGCTTVAQATTGGFFPGMAVS